MASLFCGCAIEEALRYGNAIVKSVSPNEAGLTGSHQAGFYLPKAAWRMFTPHAPEKGRNDKHPVRIEWPDGRRTESVVTWYGQGTRSEYRLTRFGRDCPWLAPDTVGNLLMLVPRSHDDFAAFVFDHEEDIEEIGSALGIEPRSQWAVYQRGAALFEDADECLRARVMPWVAQQTEFPSGDAITEVALAAVAQCCRGFDRLTADELLMRGYEAEYSVFRMLERHLSSREIERPFADIDDFLATAARVMNRRKARAGRSLENHVHRVLRRAGVAHEMRPAIDGEPDVVIPSAAAYRDPEWPEGRLFIMGIKTTCKDRWRQVLNEGKRKREKYLLTVQPGISAAQLGDMYDAGVQLVVPESLHRDYPPSRATQLLTLEQFVARVKAER